MYPKWVDTTQNGYYNICEDVFAYEKETGMYCKNCGAEIADEAKFCGECGTKTVETVEEVLDKVDETTEEQPLLSEEPAIPSESKYTGGAFGYFFSGVLVAVVSIISLFFAAPAMLCWRERYVMRHTYINGMRLTFDGKGSQLFGRFMLWTLLSVITFGIYYLFFMSVAVEKWTTKHTHFEAAKTTDGGSVFDGSALGLLGTRIAAYLVTAVTLSIGYYWAHCYEERWFCKHTKIDGCALYFDGTGMQYFGKRLLWTFLTVITLGIYSFWLIVKSEQWTVSHTHTDDVPELDEEKIARIIEQDGKPISHKAFVIAGFALPIVSTILSSVSMATVREAYTIVYFTVLAIIIAIVGLVISVRSIAKQYSPRALAIVGVIYSAIAIVQPLAYNLMRLIQ